jgi:hypothetical protein
MSNTMRGMISGFIATLVLSALLLLKDSMGLYPQLNFIKLLTNLGSIGTVAAWMDHFIIGTVVWGLLFAAYDSMSDLPAWLKGLIIGAFGWLVMMVLFLPVAKAGLFGMKIGIEAPIVLLALHLIYGAVLGVIYGLLTALVPAKAAEQPAKAPEGGWPPGIS